MRIDRRRFFRLLARLLVGAAALFGVRSSSATAASEASEALDIHQATRNTRLGALGAKRPRLSRPPRPFKPYPGKRRIALPAPPDSPARTLAEVVREWAPAQSFGAEGLTLAQLARLLHFTNGVTSPAAPGSRGPARRAAPSAGALYSGEVYIAAARVRGLAAGLYYYDVRRHALVEVAAGFSAARFADAIDAPMRVEGMAAAILLSNVFERYSWRYANRGYRYALIDSGHIGENLRLAAASAGLAQCDMLTFRDDVLNDLLGLDGREEAVCAVHAIGSPGKPLAEEIERSQGWIEAQYKKPFEARGPITERYHAATQLVVSDQGYKDVAQRVEASAKISAHDVTHSLPVRTTGPAMKLEQAIQIRRSTTRFDPSTLALADLGQILEMAHGHSALSLNQQVDVYLVVHRVEALGPGLYRYDRDRHSLVRLRPGALVADFTRVCLGQDKAGTAAVGVLMVARLGAERALASTRRYREILIESGAIGQRIYLAAESAGLSARNLAAFLDDDLNRLLGLDGVHAAVIHLTMLGPGD